VPEIFLGRCPGNVVAFNKLDLTTFRRPQTRKPTLALITFRDRPVYSQCTKTAVFVEASLYFIS